MTNSSEVSSPWPVRQPGQPIGRGHGAGEPIEAYKWKVIEEREGFLRGRTTCVEARLFDPLDALAVVAQTTLRAVG
jgi:hypothetical protein